MKKLSSMLALSLALAMVMGMTAFASDSQDTENNTGSEVVVVPETPGVTANVVTVEYDENGATDLGDVLTEEEYDKLWEKINEGIPAGAKETENLTLAAVIELGGDVPEDGIVRLASNIIPNEGLVYYAYHYKDGVCEVLNVEINEDGTITIYGVTGFSPFIIVGWEKDPNYQPPKEPDKTGESGNSGNNGAAASDSNNAGTSPKTGESTSMAMLIVLVSLAGASVLGAKKAFSAR